MVSKCQKTDIINLNYHFSEYALRFSTSI